MKTQNLFINRISDEGGAEVGMPWFAHPSRSRPLLLHLLLDAQAVTGCTKRHTSPRRFNSSRGQALVVLLVFMVIGIIMTTMAVALVIINATAVSQVEQGDMALKLAESGAENALLRLVRDPTYVGTEAFPLDSGSVTATISGSTPIIIVSTGRVGTFARTASVSAHFTNTILLIDSWREVF